ncbi:hypothetical protein ABIB81_007720 [Bradyrhizobium sp. I1.7.5]
MHGKALSFDISLKEPSLLDYLPNITETADVIDTYGKMQLMDPLIIHDGVAKTRKIGRFTAQPRGPRAPGALERP